MTFRIAGLTSCQSRASGRALLAATAWAVMLFAGCAHVGRLQNVGHTVAPMVVDSTKAPALADRTKSPVLADSTKSPFPADSTEGDGEERDRRPKTLRPLFGGSFVALAPGTADSSIRFLGRLHGGFVSDTLNIILCGDNRPGYRLSRLDPQLLTIRQGLSPNPLKFLKGLITIPWLVVKGLYPDFALIREVPAIMRHMPTWGREHQVMTAMMAEIDSVEARGQSVAAVINTGDLVFDGQYPAHWERFLRITEPLTSRVPYFPIAGNHERTDTVDGVENWRTATGLPIGGDRLYYCFDSADGWVRFIALDTNPIVDPQGRWTSEVRVKYSEEEFTWLVARIKEHSGPVLVVMHHPPFSASAAHRLEWQRDGVLIERRERMVKALHEAGISIIAAGHEHSYQRALLTWPDAVLIAITTGGAGAPLHQIPPPAESAQLFSDYKVAGSVVKPDNVFTSQVFNFTLMRLWFGGGEFYSYAVDQNSQATLIDKVQIDLNRYGIPKIDQHKMIVPPSGGPTATTKPAATTPAQPVTAKGDSTTASERLLSKPPPSGTPAHPDSVSVQPPPKPTPAPGKGQRG